MGERMEVRCWSCSAAVEADVKDVSPDGTRLIVLQEKHERHTGRPLRVEDHSQPACLGSLSRRSVAA
jgi:hypothetical protein